ncbi:MAG TPA: hypothetical protein VG841_00150 [Caulobacterales bacterium]|nr:hypothetical protein [Caulobacterales bacterium]
MPRLRWLSLPVSSALVLALVWLAAWPIPRTPDGDDAPHAILVSIENKIGAAPRKARSPAAVLNATASKDHGEGLTLQLWRYTASGEILFETWDQHRRCTEARARRRDESDCPSFLDRTPIARTPRSTSAVVIALDEVPLPRYASSERRN